jgi:hypothetical protein
MMQAMADAGDDYVGLYFAYGHRTEIRPAKRRSLYYYGSFLWGRVDESVSLYGVGDYHFFGMPFESTSSRESDKEILPKAGSNDLFSNIGWSATRDLTCGSSDVVGFGTCRSAGRSLIRLLIDQNGVVQAADTKAESEQRPKGEEALSLLARWAGWPSSNLTTFPRRV